METALNPSKYPPPPLRYTDSGPPPCSFHRYPTPRGRRHGGPARVHDSLLQSAIARAYRRVVRFHEGAGRGGGGGGGKPLNAGGPFTSIIWTRM